MTLQPVIRTSKLAGELELCKRVLASAIDPDVEPAVVVDVAVACKELKSCIREYIASRRLLALDAERLDKLDLNTVGGRWALCMAVLGPIRPAILHEMYKGFVAYNVSVLCKYRGDTMTDLFKALKGELHISEDPAEFLNVMLASLREQWKGSDAKFIRRQVDKYIVEIVILTIEKIDEMLAVLAPRIGLGEMLQSMQVDALLLDGGLMTQSADELEAAGAPAGIVGAARMMEEEAARAQELPDELEARGRIHEAVLQAMHACRHHDPEAPATPEVTEAWAMHPERLTVSTPAGDISLIEGVMNEPLDVEQIVTAICRHHVTYAERVGTSS